MYTILISKKLASVLRGGSNRIAATDKSATKWEDLSYEKQVAYIKRHPKTKRKVTSTLGKAPKVKEDVVLKKKEYDSMSIPEIQESVKEYQKDMSAKEFKKLYQNFLPLMLSTVKKVVGSRHPSKDDYDDLKQQVGVIFAKALSNADPTNQGIISYFQESLYRQLLGKAREIFRSSVTIHPKDRRAQRAVQKYIHNYYDEHRQMPTDYDQMARDISADPSNRVTHLTPDLITDLMQSGAVSMEAQVGGDDDKRTMGEVLGPKGVQEGTGGFFATPEEEAIQTQLKETVRQSIEQISDEDEKRVLKLFYGLDDSVKDPQIEGNITAIATLMGIKRKEATKLLQNASRRLRNMSDIQRLRESSSKIFKIIANINKHIKFAYTPDSIKKMGSSFLVDGFTVKQFGKTQYTCSCGKNCFHKDAVMRFMNA